MSYDNSNIKIVYVLLDGVGDLPHPDIENKTPLEKAVTPNLDRLSKNGKMGQVISVGKGIAPESDIAVFNILGYKFHHADYAGRGVIEAIGIGIDFKNGDLALRGNFATLDEKNVIVDRRAGRNIEREDATGIAKEIEENIDNTIQIAGDFTEVNCQAQIKGHFKSKVDVLVSDMAVNTTGNKNIDAGKQGRPDDFHWRVRWFKQIQLF